MMPLDTSEYLRRYAFDPTLNVTYQLDKFSPSMARAMYAGDDAAFVGWGYENGDAISPLYQAYAGGDEGVGAYKAPGVQGFGDIREAIAREDLINSAPYARGVFDATYDLIRRIDPTATEQDVFNAARGIEGEPGKYDGSARRIVKVADAYLSSKTGKPVSLADTVPGVSDWISASDKQASEKSVTWRDAWNIYGLPIMASIGAYFPGVTEALAAEIAGSTGASTAVSNVAANAIVGAGKGAIGAGLSGGDIGEGAISGAVTGGAGGAATELAPAIQSASQVGDFIGLTPAEAKAVASMGTSAASAALLGRDPTEAAMGSLGSSAFTGLTGSLSGNSGTAIASGGPAITPVSDDGNDYSITTAEDTTLGQGLPSDNMSDFFSNVINWDEGSDWLTGNDTAFANPGVWDESMATQEQVAAAAAGYLKDDGSIDYQRWFADIDKENPHIDSSTTVPASEVPWDSVLRRLPEFAKLFPGGAGLTEQAKTWLNRMTSGASTGSGRNASGTGGRSWLDMGLMMAPSLAAMNYARNMSGPDTSRLEKIYGQMDPAAALGAFDLQTNDRRSSLETSLARRGVMGSSFANDDLTSFNTTRDVGRRNLLNSGLESQAKIATDIATLQDKGTQRKVDLYGRALNSLGLAFGGSRMMGG